MAETRWPARFRDPDDAPPWRDPVLVVCPRCGGRATAQSTGPCAARLLCLNCTLVREWAGDRLHVLLAGRPVMIKKVHHLWRDPETGKVLRIDFSLIEGQERRFGVPLWLRTTCCGGRLLWANNEAHLDHLESYVSATLRTTPGRSWLAWYLPTWMKEAKHRDEVLRAIGRLRASLDQ